MSIHAASISIGFVTEHVVACRDFYTRHFGFEVAADLGWYVHLRLPGGRCDLGLVLPDRPELDVPFHVPLAAGGVYWE